MLQLRNRGFGRRLAGAGQCLVMVAACLLLAVRAGAAEPAEKSVLVNFVTGKKEPREIVGRVLVKAADGGVLVEARDGRYWSITPDKLQSIVEQMEEFAPLSADEQVAAMRAELTANKQTGATEVVMTEHYVIVSTASRPYAEWCGQVLERLFKAFGEFVQQHGLKTHAPASRLPVIVLASQAQFAGFATADAGPVSAKGQGYYSITSNRVVLYDLTVQRGQVPLKNRDDVVKRLRAAASNVATVVHEATHQIAFNTGVHRRYADNPVWLTEGLAMHFEAADFLDDEPSIGKANATRLKRLKEMLKGQRLKPLESLTQDDKRFQQAVTALDAYAEAWALTYVLLENHGDRFAKYLGHLQEKPVLVWDTPVERATEFEQHFGAGRELEAVIKKLAQRGTVE